LAACFRAGASANRLHLVCISGAWWTVYSGEQQNRGVTMTATTGNTHSYSPADQGRMRHVLLCDDLGYLTLERLRPWHRMLARCDAARLDRELAAGASPESSAILAARAMQLTSLKFRRDLVTSVLRILAAAGGPPAAVASGTAGVRPPRLPVCRARISRSAVPLAKLAGCLASPSPVGVRGVAMVSRLLADGTGPLYREACGDDLVDIIERATQALTR
jgi:hypothetical protein